MKWVHAKGSLSISPFPVLMGILNVTPDSFSDGGRFLDPDRALAQALRMVGQGADIIDIGGESTRPGAEPIVADVEKERVLPVIQRLAEERPDILISIDTTKASVARAALNAGAGIVNDISGGLWDPEILHVVKQHRAGYVCTHTLDRPDRMQHSPSYHNVVEDILNFLLQRQEAMNDIGLDPSSVCYDVGIGFGKTPDHNLDLIRAGAQDAFAALNRPLVWGLSRKSFIEKVVGAPSYERFAGGIAAHAHLLNASGPQIWRVHEVKPTRDYLQMFRALNQTLTG